MNPLLLGPLFEIGKGLIDRLIPDPAKKAEAEMRLLELQTSGELAKLAAETKITEAFLADTQSARDREAKVATSVDAPLLNKVITPVLAMGILAAVFGGLFYLISVVDGDVNPTQKDIVIYVLGALTTMATQVIAYYFGSSQGSTAKDQTLKRMLGRDGQ